MFEAPLRQPASEMTPLTLFAPAHSTISFVPLTRNLSPADLSLLLRRHSVPETPSYGTEYTCRAQKGFLGYATRFQRHSVRKNRLLRYGRDIRCQKQPSLVRDASSKARRTAPAAPNAFSKARRTADSTDCGQPPVVRDAFSGAPVHENPLLLHRMHLQCAERPPRGGEQT